MKRGEGGSSGGVERGVAWGGGKVEGDSEGGEGSPRCGEERHEGGSREEREVSTGDGERDQRKKICGGVDSRVFLFLYA
jgi:hypothetical protein